MTNNRDPQGGFRVVAIDGGAASGKSSTSRAVARACHLLHVDTGSHYRALAHVCLQAGVDPRDETALRDFLNALSLQSRIRERESLICFNGGDPPPPAVLRSDAVNRSVSLFAERPLVRETVKTYQREQLDLARRNGFNGVIMDGRDIGTVILPDADLKIFLTADPSTRQERRALEGSQEAIADRDNRDSSRENAPLRAAPDAVIIDNSELSLDEVVERIVRHLARL